MKNEDWLINLAVSQMPVQMVKFVGITWSGVTEEIPQATENKPLSFPPLGLNKKSSIRLAYLGFGEHTLPTWGYCLLHVLGRKLYMREDLGKNRPCLIYKKQYCWAPVMLLSCDFGKVRLTQAGSPRAPPRGSHWDSDRNVSSTPCPIHGWKVINSSLLESLDD